MGQSELCEGDLLAERYRIIRKISQGGMGTVYLAQHALIERLVAVKVLSPEFAAAREGTERFLLEARAAARIVHENIVAVYDFGETEDSLFIVMEYLEGRDLGHVLRSEGPLSPQRIRTILTQVCRALAAAHAAGIIHRDLKPENIFLLTREEQEQVKVLDFGVAQVAEERPLRGRLTLAGTVVGTPEYMAPEQVLGEALDHRADVYALGCILYEMLVGAPPFGGRSSTVLTMAQRLYEPPIPPSQRAGRPLPPLLEAICLRALERDKERRFQSMQEMLAALAVPDGEVTDMTPLPGQPSGAWASLPHPALGSSAVLAALPPAQVSGTTMVAGPDPAQQSGVPPASRVAALRLWPYVLLTSIVSAVVALVVTLQLLGGPVAVDAGPRPVPAGGTAGPAAATAGTPGTSAPERLTAAAATQSAAPTTGPPLLAPAAVVAADASAPPPRLRIKTGARGAQVRLNGRQYLGKIPLDVQVPMLLGLPIERAHLLVTQPGCEALRLEVTLMRGAVIEQQAALLCQRGGGTSRSAMPARDSAPSGRGALPPAALDGLRNPFGAPSR